MKTHWMHQIFFPKHELAELSAEECIIHLKKHGFKFPNFNYTKKEMHENEWGYSAVELIDLEKQMSIVYTEYEKNYNGSNSPAGTKYFEIVKRGDGIINGSVLHCDCGYPAVISSLGYKRYCINGDTIKKNELLSLRLKQLKYKR